MRLQKYLAHCGVASRRKSEMYILEGRVKVNGKVVTELGAQIQAEDCITWDDQPVVYQTNYVYYLLHKPVGYVTTAKDEKDRPTVLDFFKNIGERVYPVGRLDYNTSGLLILTNDGALTYALTHPKHHVNKTYHVKVKGSVTDGAIQKLRKGVMIEGKKTAPALVNLISKNKNTTHLEIIIYEGRNRQIRKMCEAIGHEVSQLTRVAIGDLVLGDLKVAQYRKLKADEIEYLKKIGGLDAKT